MKHYSVVLHLAALVGFSLLAAFLVLHALYFTAFLVCFCLLGVACRLYREQQKGLRQMEQLITRIRYGDLNLSFPASAEGEEGELTRSMNEALSAFRARLYHSVVAEAETEAWQKLIRVLTHEIMNSMTPIISLSETVTERAASHSMNEKDYVMLLQAMQTIHRRSRGLLGFVENFRKLTRIPVPTLQPVSVSPLFADMQRLFGERAVGFSFSVKPDDLCLYADRSMVGQLLVNLLKNAFEAMEGVPFPAVRLAAWQSEGTTVITLSDNGQGIVSEAIDEIFVPFFTTKNGGSGIGLSVCRQIMNRHGGSISVTSEGEGGTTFTLRFPYRQAATSSKPWE